MEIPRLRRNVRGESGVFGKLPMRLNCDFGFDGAEIGALYPSFQNRDVEHPVPS